VQQSSLPKRVIVAEPFAESGLAVLRGAGLTVTSLVGRSRDELKAALADGTEALIVRSETRVDRELLAAGPGLVVVARAGAGVDAIDVAAASETGILVLNTPGANTLAAVEQTFALMLSLARFTPDAVASLRAGRWDRKNLIGTELFGKTLGIVGLGRIGGNIAQRARAFGMRVLTYDPYITTARADAFGTELLDLDTMLGRSDIVTIHTPLNPTTRGMFDAARIANMQPHAYLINCARGGVIVEDDLLAALDAGTIAKAAIDVVAEEPPPPGGSGARLHRHPKVYSTPHLGGSTYEALERIAIELATDIAQALAGAPASGAVNAPIPSGPDADRVKPFLDVAYRIGRFYPQFARPRTLPTFALELRGALAEAPPEPIVTAFLSGLLQSTTDRRVSVVNADAIARELAVRIDVRTNPQPAGPYAAALTVTGGETTITATTQNGAPRIVELDGYAVDATPVGALLITRHRDVPGMIGRVGTVLGAADVNISTMQVARDDARGVAMMVLSTDRAVPDATREAIRAIDGIVSVRALDL
jgi:D-3-phosphoglycerate dehydrogenase